MKTQISVGLYCRLDLSSARIHPAVNYRIPQCSEALIYKLIAPASKHRAICKRLEKSPAKQPLKVYQSAELLKLSDQLIVGASTVCRASEALTPAD